MNSNRRIVFAVIAACFPVIVGFVIYFFKFSSGFSIDSKNWAEFGTFNSFFVNVSSLILIGIISYVTYKTTHTFNNLQVTPILDFTVFQKQFFEGYTSDSWKLLNCSNAAARNISIRYHSKGEKTTNWIACYSLNGNSELELPWLKFANKIEVIFSDAFSENFFKLEYKDLRGEIKPISKEKYQEISFNKRLNNVALLMSYDMHLSRQFKSGKPNFYDINNFINDFANRTGLFV